jgi:predicted double-glycine peptidase
MNSRTCQRTSTRTVCCRQSTDYTCGPAAAVTALRKLGFPAEEGQIAIVSYTSATTGTPPDILAEALRKYYGKDGLIVEYRPFKNTYHSSVAK